MYIRSSISAISVISNTTMSCIHHSENVTAVKGTLYMFAYTCKCTCVYSY